MKQYTFEEITKKMDRLADQWRNDEKINAIYRAFIKEKFNQN